MSTETLPGHEKGERRGSFASTAEAEMSEEDSAFLDRIAWETVTEYQKET
jgi:hypothetical protein